MASKRLPRHLSAITLFLSVMTPAVLSARSAAAELVARQPEETLAFVATSGTTALKPAFDLSFPGRLAADANVRTFVRSVFTQGLGMLENDASGPNQERFNAIWDDVKRVAQCPILVGIAHSAQPQGPVPVYGFVYIQAGRQQDDIDVVVKKIESLIGEDKVTEKTINGMQMRGLKDDEGVPAYWGWLNDMMILAVNDAAGMALKALQSGTPRPVAMVDKVPDTGDAWLAHIEMQKVIALILSDLPTPMQPGVSHMISVAIEALGLSNVRSMTSRAGFSGPYIVVNEFLALDGPRQGLLADIKPVELTWLDEVPAKALNADMANLDLAGMLDTVLKAADSVTGGAATPKVTMELSRLRETLGLDVRQDILDNLIGSLVAYTLPIGAEPKAVNGGLVLIAGLKDPNGFEKALLALERFVAANSQGQFQVSVTESDSHKLHSWGIGPAAMAQVIPTWTIVGHDFVIAGDMGLCALAAGQVVGHRNDSLRSTTAFQQATAGLPKSLLAMTYIDYALQIKQVMTVIQTSWPMVAMMAASKGIQLPMILPSVDHLIQDLPPGCNYTVEKDGGLYFHYQGSGMGQVSLSGVAVVALGAGILMPALARTRQLAFRMKSGTNLAHIGKGCLMYSQDHDGRFPPNLQTLVTLGLIESKSLESPKKLKDGDGPFYRYVQGQNRRMDPSHVVVYEDPNLVGDDKLNVLFLDGHVEAMTRDDFEKALKQTQKDMGQIPAGRASDSL